MRHTALCLLLLFACNGEPLGVVECAGPPKFGGIINVDFTPTNGSIGQPVNVYAQNVECPGVTVTFAGVEAPLTPASRIQEGKHPNISVDVPRVPLGCDGGHSGARAAVRVTNPLGSVESPREFVVLGSAEDDAQCTK
jgi:hypothetical protein